MTANLDRIGPDRIGPYRVIRPLGAGGMGQVFLAHDERLAREVAIKRMRPDKQDQARFHREARIAARLNHPGIVQVYDVIRDGDADCIVMEYVPGTTLRQRLAGGPLDVAEAVVLAEKIAEAMSQAHEQGIIHRDLKSENVLLTPAGQPKIGDFGIARQVVPDHADNETEDPSLTAPGVVVGTYRAMSPEQAAGRSVDMRSDLFSFGVLLYEMVTGTSPFAADNPLAMLQRIVNGQPRPAQQLVAEIPTGLSLLIEQLLQKQPVLRPRGFREVARALAELDAVGAADSATGGATVVPNTVTGRSDARRWPRAALLVSGLALALCAALVAGYVIARSKRAPTRSPAPSESVMSARPTPMASAPRYIAIVRPEAPQNPPTGEYALMATGLRTMLARSLGDIESLVVLAAADVDRAHAASDSLSTLARSVAADELITSRLVCVTERCTVSIDRIAGRDGRVLWTDSFEVPGHRFRAWAEPVAIHIRQAYAGEPVRAGSATSAVKPAVSPEDYDAYVGLRRAYHDKDRALSIAAILQQLAAIRARAPGFVRVYLLEAEILVDRFHTGREQSDIAAALRLTEAARKLAPRSPEPIMSWYSAVLAANRLDEADAALDRLHELSPGNAWVMHWRGQVLERRGQRAEAIARMREAARLHPSWRIFFDLANAEFHDGQTDQARRHIEEVVRRIPGHYDGQSLLAAIELESGHLERAEALYRELLERAPGVEEYSNLGTVLLLAGRYREAAETLDQARQLAASNPLVVFNQADAELLAGRDERAETLYRQVIALTDAQIGQQPELAGWWPYLIVRAQALAHLGESTGAVVAIQQALQKEPANDQVSYAAATVYALVDEPSSALVNALEALERGFARGWFELPWFDELRQHPRFVEQAGRP